jgi:protein-tyrosine-phosphatase
MTAHVSTLCTRNRARSVPAADTLNRLSVSALTIRLPDDTPDRSG